MKYAIRRLIRDWQFSASAILILALGIGANTSIFSLVNALLFRPNSFPNSERMVNLYQNVGPEADPAGVSFPAFRDIAAPGNVFSSATAILADDVRYLGTDGLRMALAEYTTSTCLGVLGYRPSAGRWFDAGEDREGAAPAAVIGYRTWQRQFGSDYGLLGKTIRLNGEAVTVIGIGPREMTSVTHPTLVTDFWLSMSALGPVMGSSRPAGLLERRGDLSFEVRARLQDGVTMPQAQAAMNALASRLAKDYPQTDPGKGITVARTSEVVIRPGEADRIAAFGSLLVMALMGLVLAIACSNLATLLLVRGAARAKEVSVRLSLGAARWQVVRTLLAETVVLSMCGAAAGFLLSQWAIQYASTQLWLSFEIPVDYRILAFTVAIAWGTGIAFGLAPALRTTKVNVLAALKGEESGFSLARGWFTLKNALLVSQVAGSFLLVMGTAFLIRAVQGMQTQETGFATQGVALVRFSARYAGYSEAQAERMHLELRRRVAAMPGVESAFVTAGSPVGSSVGRQIELDRPSPSGRDTMGVESAWASPGYFETLRIPLLFGRGFQDYDQPGKPHVAIVNETMARRLFGSPNAVGRRFRYGGIERSREEKTPVEIVGVVRDSSSLQFATGAEPLFYLSAAQARVETSTLCARTSRDAGELLEAIQREVRSMDSSIPILQARTMEQVLENRLRLWRQGSAVLGALGALALALASVGLYSVVRFAVSSRAREMGIRLALGARGHQVTWAVLRDVAILIAVAIAIGAALSAGGLAAGKAMAQGPAGEAVQVPGADWITLAAVIVVMAASAGAAAWLPARRAAKADPAASLRHS